MVLRKKEIVGSGKEKKYQKKRFFRNHHLGTTIISVKAENKVKEAEAEAKIAIAKAKGEAEAQKITGDGEAYYNRVVAASLNALLVQQYAIEKWNGELPQFNGSSALPFINLNK